MFSQDLVSLETTEKKEIVIAGLFPTSHDIGAGSIGRGVRPAVKLALDMINNNTEILTNYVLNMTWKDTEVSIFLSFSSTQTKLV